MLQLSAGKDANEGKGSVRFVSFRFVSFRFVSFRFERHRPEQTLLYQLVENYYPDFEMQ